MSYKNPKKNRFYNKNQYLISHGLVTQNQPKRHQFQRSPWSLKIYKGNIKVFFLTRQFSYIHIQKIKKGSVFLLFFYNYFKVFLFNGENRNHKIPHFEWPVGGKVTFRINSKNTYGNHRSPFFEIITKKKNQL